MVGGCEPSFFVKLAVIGQIGFGNDAKDVASLKDHGAIEQDADLILLLHRDDYYARANDIRTGLSEIIVAKHRNGPLDTIVCRFQGEYSRFQELNETELNTEYEDSYSQTMNLLKGEA